MLDQSSGCLEALLAVTTNLFLARDSITCRRAIQLSFFLLHCCRPSSSSSTLSLSAALVLSPTAIARVIDVVGNSLFQVMTAIYINQVQASEHY